MHTRKGDEEDKTSLSTLWRGIQNLCHPSPRKAWIGTQDFYFHLYKVTRPHGSMEFHLHPAGKILLPLHAGVVWEASLMERLLLLPNWNKTTQNTLREETIWGPECQALLSRKRNPPLLGINWGQVRNLDFYKSDEVTPSLLTFTAGEVSEKYNKYKCSFFSDYNTITFKVL